MTWKIAGTCLTMAGVMGLLISSFLFSLVPNVKNRYNDARPFFWLGVSSMIVAAGMIPYFGDSFISVACFVVTLAIAFFELKKSRSFRAGQ